MVAARGSEVAAAGVVVVVVGVAGLVVAIVVVVVGVVVVRAWIMRACRVYAIQHWLLRRPRLATLLACGSIAF